MSRQSHRSLRSAPTWALTWTLSWVLALGSLTGGLLLTSSDVEARGFRSSRFRSSRRSSSRSWGGSRRRSTYRRRSKPKPTTYRRRATTRSRSGSSRRRSGATRRRRSSSSPLRQLNRLNQARRVRRGVGGSYGRTSGRRGYGRRSYGPAGGRLRGGNARRSAYRRAAAVGLAFGTYALARDHFAAKRAAQYPTAFPQQPETRPAYLPATMAVNGEQRPIVWSDELKSYAVKKRGKLVPYKLLGDRAATTSLMSTAGYFWGPKPTTSRVRSGGGTSWLVGLLVGGVVFLVFLIIGFIVLRAIKRSLLGPAQGSSPKLTAAARRKALKPPSGLRDDPDHPDFWLQLAVEDFVVIHDFQAFEDAVDGPKGVRYGDDFRIASLVRLRGAGGGGGGGGGGWDAVLAELTQIGMQPLFLLAWREGGTTQLSVYYVPNGFSPGTRVELLDRDETWLFAEPTRDDWRPGELHYNPAVTHVGTTADGREVEQSFALVPPGALSASASMEPATPSLEAATVVRWRCATAEKNPLMLLVEIGADLDTGGALRLWLGTPVARHEVEVTPGNIRA